MKPVPDTPVIGTTFPKAAWKRWTRKAALQSGCGFPQRIIRREPQNDRLYLFS
jgi:hypothetical protein